VCLYIQNLSFKGKMKLAKLVNNSQNWTSVSKSAQTGIKTVINDLNKSEYYFGLEEWNNCKLFLKHKIGYLDAFRSFKRQDFYKKIELINLVDKTIYHVGTIENVTQIKSEEISSIRAMLKNENWLNLVETDFKKINDLRPIDKNIDYLRCWNSKRIVAPTNEGFIVNIRYEKLIFFHNPRNLTRINRTVNNRWRRLIHLYHIPTDMEALFS
jgi:hypothetical protein